MSTGKIVLIGAGALVVYALVKRSQPRKYPPAPPGYYGTDRGTSGGSVGAAAVAFSRQYGAEACIKAGYDSQICTDASKVAGDLVGEIWNGITDIF